MISYIAALRLWTIKKTHDEPPCIGNASPIKYVWTIASARVPRNFITLYY